MLTNIVGNNEVYKTITFKNILVCHCSHSTAVTSIQGDITDKMTGTNACLVYYIAVNLSILPLCHCQVVIVKVAN